MSEPLFGEPDTPVLARSLSAKDRDDAKNKEFWRRLKGASRVCDDCFLNNVTSGVSATWLYEKGGAQTFLCYRHKALRLEAGALGA